MQNTYTSRKALKLATALYMITDIMSEKEPLKWHLRNCAVALLEADVRNMRAVVERTLDILTIARIARAVSVMNADVLEQELRALLEQVLGDSTEGEPVAPLFGKEFFAIQGELAAPKTAEAPVVTSPVKVTEEVVPQVEVKATPAPVKVEAKVTPAPEPVVPKREEVKPERQPERPATTLIPQGIRSAFMPRVTLVDADVVDRQARTDDVRSNRREIIINTIREKETCSIKDITAKLPSVSEKTIQRELAAMTEEGILAKTGDRRWATYKVVATAAHSY